LAKKQSQNTKNKANKRREKNNPFVFLSSKSLIPQIGKKIAQIDEKLKQGKHSSFRLTRQSANGGIFVSNNRNGQLPGVRDQRLLEEALSQKDWQIKELEAEVNKLHRATKISISKTAPAHEKLRKRFWWYQKWHEKDYASSINAASATAFVTAFVISLTVQLLFPYLFGLKPYGTQAAVTLKTWTAQGDFESNTSTTGDATTRASVDTSSAPGDVKLSTAVAAGGLDTAFDTDGIVQQNPSAGNDYAQVMTADSSYIYVGGMDNVPGNDQWRLEKRDITTGALVTAFDGDGIIQENPGTGDDRIDAIAVDSTYIYVGGSDLNGSQAYWRLEKRDKTTGALVTAFDGDGIVQSDGNPYGCAGCDIHAIAVDSSYVYTGGNNYGSGNFIWSIEKRNITTGALVTSVTQNISAYEIEAMTSDANYLYILAGFQGGNTGWRFEKRDKNFNLVTAFDGDGILLSDPSSGLDWPTDITVDASYIYAAGTDVIPGNNQWRIEKRDITTGALVTAFDGDGVVQTNLSTGDDTISAITVDSTNIYVVGYDYSPGNYQWRIERRNITTGALDTTFDGDGIITENLSTGADVAYASIIDSSNIYMVGVDSVPGNYQWRIEKRKKSSTYNTAGTIGATGTGLRFDSGAGLKSKWLSLDWTGSGLTATYKIGFQVKPTDQADWSGTYYNPSTGASGTYYYITSGTSGNIPLFGSIQNTRKFEVKVSLEGDGGNTPTLSSFVLNYDDDGTPPTDPTNLQVISTADTTTDLSWTASTDSGSGLWGYELQKSLDGSAWDAAVSPSPPTNTTYQFTGLAANTKYYFRTRAKDNAGNYSNYDTGTSVQVTIQSTNVVDTHITNDFATSNFETVGYLQTRGSGGLDTALLQVGLSDLPVGSIVDTATLSLQWVSGGGETVYARRLLRNDWVPTQATYNIYKTASNWSTAGARSAENDYTTTDATSAVIAGSGWTNLTVTNQVATAAGLSPRNYNVGLYQTSGCCVNSAYSTNYGTSANRPKLVIDYHVPSVSAYTKIQSPTSLTFSNITSTAMDAVAQGTFTNIATPTSGIYFAESVTATNSGWQTGTSWSKSGLSPNTQYSFTAKTRNQTSTENAFTSAYTKYTLANVPGAPTVAGNWSAANGYYEDITVDANGNPGTTNYAVTPDNGANWVQADGSLSASVYWQTGTAFAHKNLTANTAYSYTVKAKNNDNTETALSASGSDTTPLAAPTGETHTGNATTTITWDWADVAGAASYKVFSGAHADGEPTQVMGCADVAVSTCTATGLAANTQYTVHIHAVNANGTGAGSGTTQAYTSIETPTGITFGTIATTSLQVSASGTLSNLTLGSSGVLLTNNTAATNSGWVTTNTWTSTPLTVNTQYAFKAQGRNGDGDLTGETALSNKYTLANVPGLPTVEEPGATALRVIINQNGNPAGTGYAIYETSTLQYVQADGTLGLSTVWQDYATWGGATGVTVTGLAANTQYTFNTKARNGDLTETANSSNVSKYTLSAAPTNPAATDGTYTDKINVSWTASASANHYHVWRDGVSGVGTQVHNLAATSFDDTITGSHTYYIYSVNTEDAENSSYISDSGYTLTVPTAPTIGAPTALSTTSIRWNFSDNASNETGFKLHDASHNILVTDANPNLTYIDETGLSPNTQYTRHVHAYNGAGDSAVSGDGTKYTLANVPAVPTVNTPATTSLKVIINQNSNPAGTGYAIWEVVTSQYVQASGILGAGVVWQDYATWGGATGVTVTGLTANKQYSFQVKARNGDLTETAYSGLQSLYTLPLDAAINSVKSTGTWYNTANFDFTNQNSWGEGGAQYYRYVWDTSIGHTWTDTEATWSNLNANCPGGACDVANVTLSQTAPADGQYVLHLKAYNGDNVAQSGTAVNYGMFLYDATVPGVTDNQAGDNIWRNSNSGTYNIDYTDAGGSNLEHFQTRVCATAAGCVTPSQDWTTQVSSINAANYDTNWAVGASTWAALAEGTNYISVRIYDEAGNVMNLQDAFYIRKDTANPVTAGALVNDGTAADVTWTTSLTQLSANWSGFSDASSGIGSYEYSIGTTLGATDVLAWTDNAMGTAVTKSGLTLSQAQIYYVNVRAIDNANNTSAVVSSNGQTVDSIAAATLSAIAPLAPDGQNSWYISVPTITLSASDATSGVAQTYYSWTSATGPWSAYAAPVSPAQGNNTLYYYSTDTAGNNETAGQRNVKFDNINPTVPQGLTATAVSTSQINLSWTASVDAHSGIARYVIYASTDNATFNQIATTANTTYADTGLTAGTTYYYRVLTQDNAGNQGANSSVASAQTQSPPQEPEQQQQTPAPPQEETIVVAPVIPQDVTIKIGDSQLIITPNESGEVNVLAEVASTIHIKVSLNGATSARAIIAGQEYALSNTSGDIWEGDVGLPKEAGTYTVKVKSKTKDGKFVEQQVLTVLIDPSGYVFDSKTKARIANGEVKLFEKQKDSSWQLWDAKKYSQNNPQATNKSGEYGFMTPRGTYQLEAQAPGYKPFKSKEIVVKSEPVIVNIALEPEPQTVLKQRNLLIGVVALFVLLIISVNAYYIFRLHRLRGK